MISSHLTAEETETCCMSVSLGQAEWEEEGLWAGLGAGDTATVLSGDTGTKRVTCRLTCALTSNQPALSPLSCGAVSMYPFCASVVCSVK